MVKLSAELISSTPLLITPLKDKCLDLHGKKIPLIENLGVTKDQYDMINLGQNMIHAIPQMGLLTALQTLILSQNRINSIHPELSRSVPNLQTLLLDRNQITNLSEFEALVPLKRLRNLDLRENPCAKLEDYRLWFAFRQPSVRVLDYEKITAEEQRTAKAKYQTTDGRLTAAADLVLSVKAQHHAVSDTSANDAQSFNQRGLTDEDRKKIARAIAAARTTDEVRRLERALKDGFIPEDIV